MKTCSVLFLILAGLASGCATSPTALPSASALPPITTASPTSAPLANTPPPQTSTSAAVPTSPAPAATITAPASPSTEPRAPAVLARLDLLSLPGEGRAPVALAQLGDALYVGDRESDNIAVVRGGRVQAFIAMPTAPVALVADPERGRLLATTSLSQTLSVIEQDSIRQTLTLTDSIGSLALFENNLYLGFQGSSTIEVRDAGTLESKGAIHLSQGFGINRLVVDESRRRLYAAVYEHVVAVDLDTMQEVFSFPVPLLYTALAVNPADGSLWAGSYDSQEQREYLVEYVERGTPLRRVGLGGNLQEMVFDSSGREFVANGDLNQVAVVQATTGAVLAKIDVGVGPAALSLDEANHLLYVANQGSDNVTVIDTTTLHAQAVIPVGMDVSALLADESHGRVYAANASTDSVFVVQGGRVVNQVAVGHHPVDLARDPKTNRLFVASYADGALTVVDENSLTVQASLPITRGLETVAVDADHNHLFADSTMYSLDTLQPEGVYLAHGSTVGSRAPAEFVRINPAQAKLYVFAYNGIPGSNARTVLYTFAESDLTRSHPLDYGNGGNITALAIDPTTQRVYATATHPLSYHSALEVWDANDNHLMELALTSRTGGLALNPDTQHLFLAHAFTYEPVPGALNKRDNAVQILDTRTLGEVGWLDVPGGPGPMALLGSTVYVAGLNDGALTLIGDAALPSPPAPTATFTPTPYPTWTPTSAP